MKFICSPIQMRLFKPPPHYQSLQSRGEQNPDFWKEVVDILVNDKHNTETLWNGYPIMMFQGGSPYELYFIAIDNWGQVIIGPNKKIVATYVVGELKVLIWILLQLIPQGCNMEEGSGYDDTIDCAEVVSVSTSCSRCSLLMFSSCSMTHWPHGLVMVSSCTLYI